MAKRVWARRLTEEEGRRLQQIVRRGKQESIRVRRAMMVMASAAGTPVPAIARLVSADADTVRDVIHAFNACGLEALEPRWAGGRPRRISDADEAFIVATAKTRPHSLDRPFTHWSVRKLADYLGNNPQRVVRIGREQLREILRRRHLSFQRTRTWKESADPDKDAKLDRIEEVTRRFPGRCFRLRPIRAVVDPALSRHLLGGPQAPRSAAGHLPPHARLPLLPRLLLPERGSAVGHRAAPKGGRSQPGRAEVDPGRPPGRRPDLRDHGQPVGQQNPGDPRLGEEEQGRAVFHADQRFLGQSDRAAVRAAAHLRDRQLRSSQPCRAYP
jgi:transposase